LRLVPGSPSGGRAPGASPKSARQPNANDRSGQQRPNGESLPLPPPRSGFVQPRLTSIEIVETIAVVRHEVAHWSGKLAGTDTRMSDVFTLLKTDAGWKMSSKTFHWHTT